MFGGGENQVRFKEGDLFLWVSDFKYPLIYEIIETDPIKGYNIQLKDQRLQPRYSDFPDGPRWVRLPIIEDKHSYVFPDLGIIHKLRLNNQLTADTYKKLLLITNEYLSSGETDAKASS